MWGIYARQSTPAQLIKHAESTEMQTDDLIRWLVDRGIQDGQWQLFDADLGVSGTLRIDQRTGLQELVERIQVDEIKAVLVYQISRLFRDDTGIQYNVFADICKKHNCMLVTSDGMIFNFQNRTHMQMFRFLAQYAAEYIPQQIGLLHTARLRKARRGLYAGLGVVPSGFIVDYDEDSPTYKKPILYEPHAERVMMFLERYYALEGHMGYLCRELDKLPYLFPPFESWVDRRNVSRWKKRQLPGGGYSLTRKGLELLLCNPFLLGWLIVEGEIISRANHAPLVDKEHEYLFWYAFDGLSEYTLTGEKNEKRERAERRFYQNGTVEEAGILKHRIHSEGYKVYVHSAKDSRFHYAFIPDTTSTLYRSIGHDIDVRTIDNVFEPLFFAHMRETRDFDVYRQWVREETERHTSLLATIDQQLTEIDNQQEDILTERLAIRRSINAIKYEKEQAQAEVEAAPTLEGLIKRSARLKETKEALIAKKQQVAGDQTYQTARKFADFQTELEKLIEVWSSKPFAVRKEFVNLCVTRATVTVIAPHWIELSVYWKHPAWKTDTLFIRRKNGGKEFWTEEELRILQDTYATASREDILSLLPTKPWGSIRHKARSIGLTRTIVTARTIPEHLSLLDWQFMQERHIGIDEYVRPVSQCTNTIVCQDVVNEQRRSGNQVR